MDGFGEYIPVDTLPEAGRPDLTPLDSRYATALTWTLYLYAAVILAGTGVLGYIYDDTMTPWVWLVATLGWALFIAAGRFWIGRYTTRFGYGIKDREIYVASGIWFTSFTVIPFSRIQHCELHSGPIDRRLGLSSLTIHTAGGDGSDISIPGLDESLAIQIKQHITAGIARYENE